MSARSVAGPGRPAGLAVPVFLLAAVAAACSSGPPPVHVDDAALANEAEPEDWLGYGRTYSEQRFSPLDRITDANVGRLAVDWYLELPNDRGLVSTPLVSDGILYFVGSMNRVRAVDAASGDLLWEYDPKVAEHGGARMRAGWEHSRGIALWGDKVYVATWDGRLNAVDRATGEEVWSTMTVDPDLPLYITGAPKVFKGKVLVGNGGTEIHAARGYVTAYDAATGERAWRFWIVPGNPADGFESPAMEMAAETWTGEWWKLGGGGNAWHGFTYDPELDQLYIGTGNGSPWNRKVRSPGGGDNLFLSSVVALDPDTGAYLWHYQTTPGETWDFNSNMDIVLAELEIDGRTRNVLLHAPKNGFFYVIDRTNGELISAEPFSPTLWATHVDPESGRPVETADARYEDGEAVVAPGPWGAHSWHAMSYNPRTGLAYIPTIHQARRYSDEGIDLAAWRPPAWRSDVAVRTRTLGSSREDGVTSSLQAWDPVAQERVWEVPMEGYWNAGTLTTAGNLVFQGRVDGTLRAYAADSGEELWRHDLGLGISAPPITYSVDGRQYVALLVGWGGVMTGSGGSRTAAHGWAYGAQTRRLVAFSLEGASDLPPQPDPVVPTPLAAPDFRVDSALAAAGRAEYRRCGSCHGGGVIASGMAPDLRASAVVLSEDAFADVVRGGARSTRGMPPFPEMTDERLLALRHYIRRAAEGTGGSEERSPAGARSYRAVTDDRLERPDAESWLSYRGTYDGWGYSRLEQIDVSNVRNLEPVWTFSTGVRGGHESPPVVNDGVMFVTTPGNHLLALDARKGDLLWRYEHELPEDLVAFHDTNRGVALYGDRVYMATLDARVVALDALTGEVAWNVAVADNASGYYMTLAPLAARGKIMVGVSGGELGIRGFVAALDAETGEEVWRTHTVTGPGEPGNDTWQGESWRTGGAAVWLTGHFDPELGLTYWGTGNPGPWIGDQRPGDNLYTNSVVALDVDTGELVGHHQYHWNGSWDWDEVSTPLLVDVEREGRTIAGLVHPGRNGYLWILERSAGGIGFVDAQPYVHQDVFTSLDPETGRPTYDESRKPGTGRRAEFCPSLWGGKDWPPAAYNPDTRLLYVPANDNLCGASEGIEVEYVPGRAYTGARTDFAVRPEARHVGELQAWDLDSGEEVWTRRFESHNWGPVLTTAGGLVFMGGTSDRYFRAFDSRTGETLWEQRTSSGVIGVPSTYSVDGVQYVAVQSGWGVDAAAMGRRIDLARGTSTHVPQGGVLWVFALEQ